MRAKEYYEKYKDAVIYHEEENEKELLEMVKELLNDFNKEVEVLQEQRHVSTISGLVSILKEQNNKFNALSNIFIKKHGYSPFRADAYKNVIIDKLPDLKDKF